MLPNDVFQQHYHLIGAKRVFTGLFFPLHHCAHESYLLQHGCLKIGILVLQENAILHVPKHIWMLGITSDYLHLLRRDTEQAD